VEKNAAMRAFGAELIEFGEDFDEAREEAFRVAAEEDLFIVPPFHRELVRGVATYGYELFRAVPDLDAVYVPIGCGSGICGTIAARDALGAKAEIIGVVSENAPTAKLSVEAGRPVETESCRTFADGMAVRMPVPEALEIYSRVRARIVAVSDAEVAEAMRVYYSDTHNLAEGAGRRAAGRADAGTEAMAGRKVAVILCGGNIDRDWFVTVLQGACRRSEWGGKRAFSGTVSARKPPLSRGAARLPWAQGFSRAPWASRNACARSGSFFDRSRTHQATAFWMNHSGIIRHSRRTSRGRGPAPHCSAAPGWRDLVKPSVKTSAARRVHM
jgi:threonine dehydratase